MTSEEKTTEKKSIRLKNPISSAWTEIENWANKKRNMPHWYRWVLWREYKQDKNGESEESGESGTSGASEDFVQRLVATLIDRKNPHLSDRTISKLSNEEQNSAPFSVVEKSSQDHSVVLACISDVQGVNALVGGQCLNFIGKQKDIGGKALGKVGKAGDSGDGAVEEKQGGDLRSSAFNAAENKNSPSGQTSSNGDGGGIGKDAISGESLRGDGDLLFRLSSLGEVQGGLTVLYGDNGSGKSGYSRILTSACKSRLKGSNKNQDALKILPSIFKNGQEEGKQEGDDFSKGAQGDGGIAPSDDGVKGEAGAELSSDHAGDHLTNGDPPPASSDDHAGEDCKQAVIEFFVRDQNGEQKQRKIIWKIQADKLCFFEAVQDAQGKDIQGAPTQCHELQSVMVFDRDAATVHVNEKQQVVYLPPPLELLGRLSDVSKAVRNNLEEKIEGVEKEQKDVQEELGNCVSDIEWSFNEKFPQREFSNGFSDEDSDGGGGDGVHEDGGKAEKAEKAGETLDGHEGGRDFSTEKNLTVGKNSSSEVASESSPSPNQKHSEQQHSELDGKKADDKGWGGGGANSRQQPDQSSSVLPENAQGGKGAPTQAGDPNNAQQKFHFTYGEFHFTYGVRVQALVKDLRGLANEDIEQVLESEATKHKGRKKAPQDFAEGGKTFLERVEDFEVRVGALAVFSAEDKERLQQCEDYLQEQNKNFENRMEMVNSLGGARLKINQINDFFAQFQRGVVVGEQGGQGAVMEERASKIVKAFEELRTKQQARDQLSQSLEKDGKVIFPINSDFWKSLWGAAEEYSKRVAYPQFPFPYTGEGGTNQGGGSKARCVFCQQELLQEGRERLEVFKKFVGETATREYGQAVTDYKKQLLDFFDEVEGFLGADQLRYLRYSTARSGTAMGTVSDPVGGEFWGKEQAVECLLHKAVIANEATIADGEAKPVSALALQKEGLVWKIRRIEGEHSGGAVQVKSEDGASVPLGDEEFLSLAGALDFLMERKVRADLKFFKEVEGWLFGEEGIGNRNGKDGVVGGDESQAKDGSTIHASLKDNSAVGGTTHAVERSEEANGEEERGGGFSKEDEEKQQSSKDHLNVSSEVPKEDEPSSNGENDKQAKKDLSNLKNSPSSSATWAVAVWQNFIGEYQGKTEQVRGFLKNFLEGVEQGTPLRDEEFFSEFQKQATTEQKDVFKKDAAQNQTGVVATAEEDITQQDTAEVDIIKEDAAQKNDEEKKTEPIATASMDAAEKETALQGIAQVATAPRDAVFTLIAKRVSQLRGEEKSYHHKQVEEERRNLLALKWLVEDRLRSTSWAEEGAPTIKKAFAAAIAFMREEVQLVGQKKQLKELWSEADTTKITNFVKEIGDMLITDRWKDIFKRELRLLGFGQLVDLGLDIEKIGGEYGKAYFQIKFKKERLREGVAYGSIGNVLSEGEFRGVALAAFLADQQMGGTHSAMIFDDPVSSLDHNYREMFAARLAAEAKWRQVIVFTHDLVFLDALREEWGKLKKERKTLKDLCKSREIKDLRNARQLDGFDDLKNLDKVESALQSTAVADLKLLQDLNIYEILKHEKSVGIFREECPFLLGKINDDLKRLRQEVGAIKAELDGYKSDQLLKKIEVWEKEGGKYCKDFRVLCEKAVEMVLPVFKRLGAKVHVGNFDKVVGFEPYHANEINDIYDDYSPEMHSKAFSKGSRKSPSVQKLLSDICWLTYWVEGIEKWQIGKTNRSIDKKDGWWWEKDKENWKKEIVEGTDSGN